MVLISRAFTWLFLLLKFISSDWSRKKIWHVIERVDVNKFECWIFSCTFGIIFHLDHYLCVQHRIELSESWCMLPLIYLSQQVKFCLTQVVTERNELWKQKMLNIFRPHMNHKQLNLHLNNSFVSQMTKTQHRNEFSVPFSFVVKKVKIKTKIVWKILQNEQMKVLCYCLLVLKLWGWSYHHKFQICFHWTVRWFSNKSVSSENNILTKNSRLVNTDNCTKHFTKPRLLLPKARG